MTWASTELTEIYSLTEDDRKNMETVISEVMGKDWTDQQRKEAFYALVIIDMGQRVIKETCPDSNMTGVVAEIVERLITGYFDQIGADLGQPTMH